MADDPLREPEGDVALVRAVLARELDTITEYEGYARRAASPTLQAFFLHLAKEEKEHVAEAMHLIHQLDGEQRRMWSLADVRPEHFTGEASRAPGPVDAASGASSPADGAPSPAPVDGAPASARSSPPARFTVGSLKGR